MQKNYRGWWSLVHYMGKAAGAADLSAATVVSWQFDDAELGEQGWDGGPAGVLQPDLTCYNLTWLPWQGLRTPNRLVMISGQIHGDPDMLSLVIITLPERKDRPKTGVHIVEYEVVSEAKYYHIVLV